MSTPNKAQRSAAEAAFSMSTQSVPVETPVENEQTETSEEEQEEEQGLTGDPMTDLQTMAGWIKADHADAPSFEQLVDWRRQHGKLFFLPFEDKVFVYRYMKRQEWIQMKADESLGKLNEEQLQENVFDRCVLWPNLNQIEKAVGAAGLIPSVYEQIQHASMFQNPESLAMRTVKI